MSQEINIAIGGVLKFLKDIPLSVSTVNAYQSCYGVILAFCENNGISSFTYQAADMFTNSQISRQESGSISLSYYKNLRKAATLLADCMQGAAMSWGRKQYKSPKLSECFNNALAEFKARLSQKLAIKSIQFSASVARQFLIFLDEIGIHDFTALADEDVKHFMAGISLKYKAGMTKPTCAMREFIQFLNGTGQTDVNAERYLINPAPRQRKMLPCFTDREIEGIFAAIDTSTPVGKRDFAIMKLALGTGLRGFDIFNMQLSDIDWRKNEINIVQSKTNVCIQLPLLPDVGNAVADYILNGRPQAGIPHIFLRSTNPHNKLGGHSETGRNIIRRYLWMAGISHEAGDGKTFHAFRRTAGTRLVKAEVPLPSVAQILGHKDMDSAKSYIALNDDMLRRCCLDISEFATRKGGLL